MSCLCRFALIRSFYAERVFDGKIAREKAQRCILLMFFYSLLLAPKMVKSRRYALESLAI